jgi:putative transposase
MFGDELGRDGTSRRSFYGFRRGKRGHGDIIIFSRERRFLMHKRDVCFQVRRAAHAKLQSRVGKGVSPVQAEATASAKAMKTVDNKFDYRRKLPHVQKDNRAHFITSRTKDRWILPPSCRDIVLKSCLFHDSKEIELHAVVVMPDHLHLICTFHRRADGESASLTEVMQSVKSFTAHEVNRLLKRKGAVWQAESFDHVPRHEETLPRKIDYLKMNPVRADLVKTPEQYRWLWSEDMVDWAPKE